MNDLDRFEPIPPWWKYDGQKRSSQFLPGFIIGGLTVALLVIVARLW